MKYQLILAKFVKKHNRFLATIKIDDKTYPCHIPNTGRLGELLYENNDVAVRYVAREGRKTDYELVLAKKETAWYCIDSRIPNMLVKEWSMEKLIPEWHDCLLKGEQTYGSSRFDFKISGILSGYIEVKGVTLEKDGVGYFPDAPTDRGKKHLDELINAKRAGLYSAVIFVCQSNQITAFSPNRATDPEFGEKLDALHAEGVEIIAFQGNVDFDGITFGGKIPIIL